MPELYALTAPKLHGVIRGVIPDEATSAGILSELYRHIWSLRDDSSFRPTMNRFIALAYRHAIDHKLTGGQIQRANAKSDTDSVHRHLKLSNLSVSELDLLKQIYFASSASEDPFSSDQMTTKAFKARLAALMPTEVKS